MYIYFLDENFINKYLVNKEIKYRYLPIINIYKDDYNDFAFTKYLIYLKNNKITKSQKAGYYGYFESEEILANSKILKSGNFNDDLIKEDNTLYKNIVKYFNLTEIPNLVFIKYDCINIFEEIITPKKLIEIDEKNKNAKKRFSPKFNICNVLVCDIEPLIESIENYFNSLSEETDYKEDDEEDTEEENINLISMDIPILWNPCDYVVEKMNDYELTKAKIKEHYSKCEKCEVVDNNRQNLIFDKKSINLSIVTDEEGKIVIDKILEFYMFSKKYIDKKEILEEENIDENKINMIYYKNEGEIYNNSFFLINKI
jgi:hypothetical protein